MTFLKLQLLSEKTRRETRSFLVPPFRSLAFIGLALAFFITPLSLSGGAKSSQIMSFFLEFCIFFLSFWNFPFSLEIISYFFETFLVFGI